MARLKRLDHIVVAVKELEEAARGWEHSLGLKAQRVSEPAGSNLKLAPLPAGNAFLELVQPLAADHRLSAFIDDRGEGMFSLSLEVDDLDAMVGELRGRGKDVSDPEAGVLEGTRVARISRESAHGVEIQLIERR